MSSLAEISRICGVSLGAASKALSGKPGVSEVTRKRILSVAEQYNYRPNRLVHAIQQGRSMTIGLTCNKFGGGGGDFAGRIIESMLKVLYEADYDAIIINWDMCVHQGQQVLRTLAERRIDGLLMFPPADQPSQEYLQELSNLRRPIVVIDQSFAGSEEYDFVGSQDFEGAVSATEHLISLGHRDIANLFHRQSSTGRARLEGFQHAMAQAGIPVSGKWVRQLQSLSASEAYNHVRELLAMPQRPSAILCFNDLAALDAIKAAHDAGFKVPRDVSIAGFADLDISTRIHPALTTVAQSPEDIGQQAAERLVEQIEYWAQNKRSAKKTGATALLPPRHLRLPVRLEARESTAIFRPQMHFA